MLPLDAFVIGGIMLWYMRNIGLGVYTWHSSFSYGKDCFQSPGSLFSGIFVTIYMKIDQVMLQELLNAEEVGYYAAAVRLSEEVWITVPWIISGSLSCNGECSQRKRTGISYPH